MQSTICQRLCACILVVAFCFSVTMAAPHTYYYPESMKLLLDKRQPITECQTMPSLALLCYQCARAHDTEGKFNDIYFACCAAEDERQMAAREYCEQRFIQPPKRGGLWA